MRNIKSAFLIGVFAISITMMMAAVYAGHPSVNAFRLIPKALLFPDDSTKNKSDGDTVKLPYPIPKSGKKGGIDLETPSSIEKKVKIDSSLDFYHIHNEIGGIDLGTDQKVPFEEYQEQQNKKWIQDYFKQRSEAQNTSQSGGLLPNLPMFNNLFGLDNTKIADIIDIRPQGSLTVTFSEDFNRVANPNWSLREQRNAQFKFDQKIQVSVAGSIGDKFKLNLNYDTEAAFDFENMKKLNYQGKEDEIIKNIELGDVSMPVSGSLISGSQSLFGIKTKLQFGKLNVTGVFSQKKSEKKEITLEGGAQKTDFNIQADQYDANRHYFLAHYFRDNYDTFNKRWPALSNIQITRLEVWITNTSFAVQNTRTVAGFMDLGENDPNHIYNTTAVQPVSGKPPYPDNTANTLYSKLSSNQSYRNSESVAQALANPANNMTSTVDYYVLSNAQQLNPTDYTYQPQLGYISLNRPLNPGDMLGVAFEYTVNGIKHQVGEFSRDVTSQDPQKPAVLFLKMLKSVNVRPGLPIWDLMMKNIYSLNSYQIQKEDFRLQVVYADDKSGADLAYLPVPASETQLNAKPLIRVMNLDRFNSQLELKPDGNFDYLEGVTINSNNGRIIFPVVEPFGNALASKFQDQNLANKFVYRTLYDSTQWSAQQDAEKDKFFLRGSYKGASTNDIPLNAINIPPGSVKVYAGGVPLTEGTDYTVDYNLGRVHIINNSVLSSGQVIKVEAETNTLFNIQQKTLMGTRLEYNFNKNLSLGGTFLYLRERPLTPKVGIGDEPIRNAIAGLDGHWNTDSRFLTKLVDKIPLLETKEMSNIAMEGEFAKIFPGHPKLLNDALDKGGVAYLDDFEGSEIPYDLRLGNYWVLASTPQGKPDMFPEAKLIDSLPYGYKRARLSWYSIDNIFFRDNAITPTNIRGNTDLLSDPYQREVFQTEVFPNKQIPNGSPGTLQTFDLHYQPKSRGPYNYTIDGLDNSGNLKNAKQNWGGIMRRIETSDFEAANISYIEFWVMDPFIKNKNSEGGDVYINLGNISEDILRDNRKSYENGLPTTSTPVNVDTTRWGVVPTGLQINNVFANDPNARQYQDVGLDGLNDDAERIFFADYLAEIKNKVSPDAYQKIYDDPSGDNFKFFRSKDYDNAKANIVQRYILYNNPQGNTPVNAGDDNGYGSQNPDDEDVNRDFNLDVAEDYFEYKIHLKPNMQKGEGYVTDKQTANITLRNGKTSQVVWYQLKVPIREYTSKVGSISDFKSIRFMRMYFAGWEDSVILRMAEMQLVRSDWRKYQYSLNTPGIDMPSDSGNTTLDVSTVSIEKNGSRPSIPYVMPPGIMREIDYSTPNMIEQNEQSIALNICNLKDGDARAIVKNTNFDVRQYKSMRMFVHAEGNQLKDNELSVFVRLGTDFNSNYYEYEMPLKVTAPGTADPNEVWPEQNRMDLLLENFYNLKTERNRSGYSLLVPYSKVLDNGQKGSVTVVGNPDLSNLRILMLGIRNPKDGSGPAPCAEIWIDELRLTGFNEQGGWAAVGRVTTKLADFGRLELTGNRTTIGFGGLEQTLQERSQQDSRGFGLNTTFELGKFFPAKSNVQIPMLFSYSEQINRPKYNPLAPDLLLSDLVSTYEDRHKKDSVLRMSEDYTAITSLNFVGVQKLRGPKAKKPHIYDLSNWNGTYIYNKIYKRNIITAYDYNITHTVKLGYSYTFTSKPLQPFSKIKNKNLKFISDFNLYYLPQSYRMMGTVTRKYGEKLYRNTDDVKTIIDPLYDKNFTFNRDYELRHNFTRSLQLNYTANALARIEEPEGKVDNPEDRQIIKDNLMKGGTLTNYLQSANFTYNVPINKLPYLDWVSTQVGYTANYQWEAAPPSATYLGNTIQNSRNININSQLNFVNLYNKSEYLRNIIQGQGNSARLKEKNKEKTTVTTPQNQEENVSKPNDVKPGLTPAETAIGVLMSLRNIQISYLNNKGTLLPGFRPTPTILGQSFTDNAPGFPFILGSQQDVRPLAVRNNWITTDTNLTALYATTSRETFSGSILLEPIKNLRATIKLDKQVSENFQENFRTTAGTGNFEHLGPISTGNYSISYLTLNTSFVKDREDNTNATFDKFEENRLFYSKKLSEENPFSAGIRDDSTKYYLGYTKYNQDVLIPSFLAAYTGKDPSKVSLSPFPKMPMPNWDIVYSIMGNNIEWMKTYIKSINLKHGYHSVYSVNNYQSTLGYDPFAFPTIGKDLESALQIDRIVITERFSPLFGFDISWANNWTTGFDFSKDRTLSFSFIDKRLLENDGQEITFRAGYRTTKLMLPFKIRRKRAYLPNDFTFRLDFSLRDNKQLIRILDDKTVQPTNGQKMLQFSPNVQYILNKSLTLDVFIKHSTNKPYTSNQYPTSFTSVGFSLRYILSP